MSKKTGTSSYIASDVWESLEQIGKNTGIKGVSDRMRYVLNKGGYKTDKDLLAK